MATYVMSDIHGEYEKFCGLLEKISLKDTDILYILGDVLDRGRHPIKVLRKLMKMPNVIPIVGNHELMAMECLPFLSTEITKESVADIPKKMVESLLLWQGNGCTGTTDEFHTLTAKQKKEVIEYIKDFEVYEELCVNGQKYLLVHAGLGNFSKQRPIEDYSLEELVWERADYEEQYFSDTIVITGHTPTQRIEGNDRPGYIYRKNHHIAIDCGACFSGGRLAAICLETGEEFYSN